MRKRSGNLQLLGVCRGFAGWTGRSHWDTALASLASGLGSPPQGLLLVLSIFRVPSGGKKAVSAAAQVIQQAKQYTAFRLKGC